MPTEMSYCEVYLIPRSVTTLGWVSLRLSSSRASWNGIRTSCTSPLCLLPYTRCLLGRRTIPATILGVRQAYGKRGAIGQTAADQIDLLAGIRSGLIRKSSSAFIGRFDSGKSDICTGRLAQQELCRLTGPIEGFLPNHPGAFFEPVRNVHDGCAA